MSGPEQDTVKAVAEAVTGIGTPDAAAVVSKPERFPLWMLALAGPAISVMIVGIILFVGSPRWPWLGLPLWPDTAAEVRVNGLVAIACGLSGILALIVFRLASSNLKKIEARAGPGSFSIETGDGDDRDDRDNGGRGRDRDDDHGGGGRPRRDPR